MILREDGFDEAVDVACMWSTSHHAAADGKGRHGRGPGSLAGNPTDFPRAIGLAPSPPDR